MRGAAGGVAGAAAEGSKICDGSGAWLAQGALAALNDTLAEEGAAGFVSPAAGAIDAV